MITWYPQQRQLPPPWKNRPLPTAPHYSKWWKTTIRKSTQLFPPFSPKEATCLPLQNRMSREDSLTSQIENLMGLPNNQESIIDTNSFWVKYCIINSTTYLTSYTLGSLFWILFCRQQQRLKSHDGLWVNIFCRTVVVYYNRHLNLITVSNKYLFLLN